MARVELATMSQSACLRIRVMMNEFGIVIVGCEAIALHNDVLLAPPALLMRPA